MPLGHVSAVSENITALPDLRVVIGDYDRSVFDFNRRTVLIEVKPLVALKINCLALKDFIVNTCTRHKLQWTAAASNIMKI